MNKAKFLELAGQHWEEIKDLKSLDNLYDLESEFLIIMRKMNLEVFKEILGEPSKDHRKKKALKQPRLGGT